MKLRDYQQEAHDEVIGLFSTKKSLLVVMATGLGKTILLSSIADHYVTKGRVMVIAHRNELVRQNAEKIKIVTGLDPDIEMAKDWSANGYYKAEVVVASVQSLIKRLDRHDPDEYSLLVIDEAHHAVSNSYRQVVDHFRQNTACRVLGVTATPDRTDEVALGLIFDDCAYEYGIRSGIEDGWLVPIKQRIVYVEGLDLSAIKTDRSGDLTAKALDTVLRYEENLHGIASPTLEMCGDDKTIVFAASVAHAERLAEILNRSKPNSAMYIEANTPKETRAQLFTDFSRGRFQFFCNVGIATEGYDEPGIKKIIMARPTKSRCLYTQMVGRALRPLPGLVDHFHKPNLRRLVINGSDKPHAEIIDFAGNCGKHKLISSADILGGNYDDEVVQIAKERIQQQTKEGDEPAYVESELKAAELEYQKRQREREEADRRKHIIAKAAYSTKIVDAFDMSHIEPVRVPGYLKNKLASSKQAAFLQKCGFKNAGEMNVRHASQLISTIMDRRDKGLCTLAQAKWVKKFGGDPDTTTFAEAKVILDKKFNKRK